MEQSSERDQSNRVLSSVSEDVAYQDWSHVQTPSMFIYTSLCSPRHYLYRNVYDNPFSSPLAKHKMIYDPPALSFFVKRSLLMG